mgnify:CR=1 FL=1
MKQLKNMQIIGIDNGYGNLKTASGIFPASVLTFDHEPVHAQDLLVYDANTTSSAADTGSSPQTRSATRITMS